MKKIRVLFLCLVIALSAFVLPACSGGGGGGEISKYQIFATYNQEAKTVDANLKLTYVNNTGSKLNNIMFHMYPRAYRQGAQYSPVAATDRSRAYPDGISYGDMAIFRVTQGGKEQSIKIGGSDGDILTVDCSLSPASKTHIEIEFRVELPTVRHRLGYYDGVANLGNWYPVACVYKNGAFDTSPYYSNGDPFFSEIADYELTITTDQSLVAATSGRQKTVIENGKKVTTASIKNARDAAVVIGGFSVLSDEKNGVQVNYYYKNDDAPRDAVTAALDSLKTFGDMFGDYAYDSLSVVKTPFLHGGMEYPALVYISDAPEISDKTFKEVIIHETAHQWWYAAVGSNQVAEPWLDEALAEYSTTLFYQKNPSYGVTKDERLKTALGTYLVYVDVFKQNGKGDTSMNRMSGNYADSAEYTIMTYVKGHLMLDALCDSIGKENILKGFKAYYKANKFKIASGEVFIAAMESASKTNLKSFFDSWLTGKVKMFAS